MLRLKFTSLSIGMFHHCLRFGVNMESYENLMCCPMYFHECLFSYFISLDYQNGKRKYFFYLSYGLLRKYHNCAIISGSINHDRHANKIVFCLSGFQPAIVLHTPASLFKLSPWDQKWTRPRGHMHYILGLYMENKEKSSCLKPQCLEL